MIPRIVMRGEIEMSHPKNHRNEWDQDDNRHRYREDREDDITRKTRLEAPHF